jgi:amidase
MRDCAGLLDAVTGPAVGDWFMVHPPARPYAKEVGADPGRLRVAVTTQAWSGVQVDPACVSATEAVARKLESLGHSVEVASPAFDTAAFDLASLRINCASLLDVVVALSTAVGVEPGPDTLEATTLACVEYGKKLTVLDMAQAAAIMNQVCRSVGGFFEAYDVLLTPAIARPPFPLGLLDANDSSLDAERWARKIFSICPFTALFNVTGQPGISLPLGWSAGGLPIGVQVVARMCDEATLIRVGSQLEQAMRWSQRHPAVHAASTATARQ